MADARTPIFLSYASQDAEAAHRICETLRAAGIEVFFDQSELRGGDAWDHKIRKQIRDCALFIPIISKNTQARAEGYFRLEWRLADQRTHLMGRSRAFLVPICIDDTREVDADAPDSFSESQWTRLAEGQPSREFVERIQSLLSSETSGTHVAAHAARPRAAAAPSHASNVHRPWKAALIAILALLVIAIAYEALDRFVLSRRAIAAALSPP